MYRKNKVLNKVMLALFVFAGSPAYAEDIDLFLNPAAAGAGSLPSVLFVLDNSANWNASIGGTTKKSMIHQALYDVLTDAGLTDAINAGIMTFSHDNSPRGGKVIMKVEQLDAAKQTAVANMLYTTGLKTGTMQLPATNNAPYATTLYEAYRYFEGMTPLSGMEDTGGIGDNDQTYDVTAVSGGNYVSPVAGGSCGKKFIIFLANGSPDSGENGTAEGYLTSEGAKLASDPINLSPSNYASNWGDEMARFIKADADINTYAIDIHDTGVTHNNPYNAARAFMQSVGSQDGGGYYTAESLADIKAALAAILDEIQAVNSVFASTTLPVSVNVRGTNLNQVYMGVFRPDENKKPRWMGNLKMYKLAVNAGTGDLFLADSNGDRADSLTTGFMVDSAESFWTYNWNFWNYRLGAAVGNDVEDTGNDLPDGAFVEKGGVSEKIRYAYGATGRTLYTCTTGCAAGSALSGYLFNDGNANITQAALSATSAANRTEIINFIRGDDLDNEDGDGATNDVRPSVHGDVLHSRPIVVNYNTDGSDNDIVAFYGGNDGIFHAIKGGTTTTPGTASAFGTELWGFIPPEHFGSLKRIRDNTVIGATYGNKPYFVDGSIGVYQNDVNNDGKLKYGDGDKVYIYMSMRRGGRMIYALDVSNPAAPVLLWKKTNADTGWGELGQTWSEPKVAKISATANPVLIFGAGYDAAAEDVDPPTADTMGRGIMVVDGTNGTVIWQAGPSPAGATTNKTVAAMTYSIPSDVTLINRDFDGNSYIDRIYVGDVGGNIWRVDTNDAAPANWTVHKLASIGSTRKFLYPPDVVYATGYDAILMGSGDREDPADTVKVNRFYMIKDTATSASVAAAGSITTLVEGDLYDATANLVQDGTAVQQAAAVTALAGANGWYITLNTGEKVISSSVTLSGTTFFNTHEPTSAGSCSGNLGTARAYMVSYENGASTSNNNGVGGLTGDDRYKEVPGGGFSPSPVPLIVEIDGEKYQAVISGTQVTSVPGVQLETRERTYWFKNIDN